MKCNGREVERYMTISKKRGKDKDTMDDFSHFSKDQLEKITNKVIENYHKNPLLCHIDHVSITSKESVVELVNDLVAVIYPGFYGKKNIDRSNIRYQTGSEIYNIYQKLSEQIYSCFQYECNKVNEICQHCTEIAQKQSLLFLEKLPLIRDLLLKDLYATYRGDPAAKSFDEVIYCYPGFFAITIYRIAHELHKQDIPLLPRIMTEYAHGETGVDIHPGAKIGETFFIDHATGVVIGETTEIGNNVRIYQGVTLGALSFKRKEDGSLVKGGKRHPTIGNDVTIYSGATILGGKTVIGDRSVVGGNVWLTHSIPPDTTILLAEPRLKAISKNESLDYQI
jgi:serine O-acetyltransferase